MEGFNSNGLQVIISARTYNFYGESIHPSDGLAITGYLGIDKLVATGGNVQVYPNGLGVENEGYISISLFNFDGICVVSLIDATDNERFSQTFTLSLPEDRVFTIDKYISHESLLRDPGDLLPNGVLTLKIYAQLTSRYLEYSDIPKSNPSCIQSFRLKPDCYELLLDSPLGKRLSEESLYFRALRETAMIESETRSVKIPKQEIVTFWAIRRLLMGWNPLIFDSIEEIFDLYLIADKYNLPFVSETCSCFLKICASLYSTHKLLEIADEYLLIEGLKDNVKKQIYWISQTNLAEEIDKTDIDRVIHKGKVRGCFWICKYFADKTTLSFSNQCTLMCNFRNDERKEYDFYK